MSRSFITFLPSVYQSILMIDDNIMFWILFPEHEIH
jgi:hypothetical protein